MSPIKSKSFISDNFLLDSELAQILYHQYAKKMPVIDYHNHLSAKQIAENKPISNITDAWLNGDHYKWRAMRANGIDETYITGTSTQKEKFLKWAADKNYYLFLEHDAHNEIITVKHTDKGVRLDQVFTCNDIFK